MRRRLFTVASALSLVLCIETVLLWVRTYGIGDSVERTKCVSLNAHTAIYHTQWYQVAEGQLRFIIADKTFYQHKWTRIREPDISATWIFYPGTMYFPPRPKTSLMNRLGFAHWTDSYSQTSSAVRLAIWAVPLWVLTLGFAALPVSAIMNVLRRRWRVRKGLCARCGYDLTGNASGVCPECGTAVTSPVPARGRNG